MNRGISKILFILMLLSSVGAYAKNSDVKEAPHKATPAQKDSRTKKPDKTAEKKEDETDYRAVADEEKQRADAAERALNDPSIAQIRQALVKAEGNIDNAATMLANKMVVERAAEMSKGLFWLESGAIGMGRINLFMEMQSGGRLAGWGPQANTRFLLGAYFLPYSFQIRASGGLSASMGYNGPQEALCSAKGADSTRCLKTSDDGTIDWGTNSVNGYFSFGVSYKLANIVQAGVGYGADVSAFAFTPVGEVVTKKQAVLQHRFTIEALTQLLGIPVGVSGEVGPEVYWSPGGTSYTNTHVKIMLVMRPTIASFFIKEPVVVQQQ